MTEPASAATTPDDGSHHLRDLPVADPLDPPIVLIPGIDGTALLFYRQIPALARRFDVVAFPLPPTPPTHTTMATLAADLATLIREVSDQGAILLGESFGGALALTTALAYPELARGLVIVNSFPYVEKRISLRLAPWLLKATRWDAMPLVRRLTSSRLHTSHTLPEDLREFRERSKAIDRYGYIRRLEILQTYDLRRHLHEVTMPTLFLAGDEDHLVESVGWAEFMHARVPDSQVRILEGYGHICLINHDLDLCDHVGPWWEQARHAQPPEIEPDRY